jgi:CO/xanthine dehydrogenase Mo-binding subunit
MRFEHGASRDGTLVYVKAEIYLDGGAYASSTPAVVGNAGTMGIGPYVVPNVQIDAYGAYTNNPPCGAMRGFGSVQAAFAHEAQMDKAGRRARHGPDRAALPQRDDPRGRGADRAGDRQRRARRGAAAAGRGDAAAAGAQRGRPGGPAGPAGRRREHHPREGVVRGIGYAVAYKNVGVLRGLRRLLTARVRLEAVAGEAVATVHTAAAEVGQGLVTVEQQIARTELGVHRVVVHTKDTGVGSGGSTSASRQTYVTGGAVKAACEKVRERALEVIQQRIGRSVPDLRLDGGKVVSQSEGVIGDLAGLLGDEAVEETGRVAPPPDRGGRPGDRPGVRPRAVRVRGAPRGRRCGHRARPDQGRGARLRPGRRQGHQPAGGRRADPGRLGAGAGLAVMEEIQIKGGKIRNPSFTDYLIPTILDMPPMRIDVLEYADPHAPYGVRGVGEPPTISSGPAIVAAIRDATGLPLNQVPVRPEHITGT